MFNVSEYRKKTKPLSDYLPWALFIKPGILLNKDGAFQKIYKFRGPDLSSSTQHELVAARHRFNNTIRQLGSNWCLHIEARRRKSQKYYKSDFPVTAAALFDRERQHSFEKDKNQYETDYFFSLSWLTPKDTKGKIEEIFYENLPDLEASDYRRYLEEFESVCHKVEDSLQLFMPRFEALNDAQTLTYLHDCISNRHVKMRSPDVPMYIDALITDESLLCGRHPKLGDEYVDVISFRGYPGSTLPGLLEAMDHLAEEYRWVTRYIPFDKEEAEKHVKDIRRHWYAKRKGMGAILSEAFWGHPSALEDTDAINKAAQTNDVLEAIGVDAVSMGQFTPVVIVKDKDPNVLLEKVRYIQKVIESRGFVTKVERDNAVEAFLGSLPGHAYANPRRPLITSLNLLDMIPSSSVWAGPSWNEHLDGPPLMVTKTKGNSQFRLSFHMGDLAHGLVIGPPGSGKSVLLSSIALQFLRYPEGQVYIFDKGRSSRAATLSVGGNFFDLGNFDSDNPSLSFQPLSNIDDEQERAWASEWLISILQRDIVVTPETKRLLWDGLNALAAQNKSSRTLSVLAALVQSEEIKQALEPFVSGGALGKLLDADKDSFEYGSWQSFEMEGLMNTRSAVMPVLSYLFHKLEKRFTGSPTLLILDEAWLFLDEPQFSEKIREWLKVLRKKNVSVIFATQQLSDVINSNISSAVIESCPTRIFLPNPNARDKTVSHFYESFGLNSRQIDIISMAEPKRDYYFQSPEGSRIFELGLGPLELALVASSSPEDHAFMDEIVKREPENFLMRILESRGLNPGQMVRDNIQEKQAA